jgi:hypothetical protein
LSGRLRINMICGSDHSMIKNGALPYSCQPQKWLTSGGRERTHLQNNFKTKPGQLKLTKIDQSTRPKIADS